MVGYFRVSDRLPMDEIPTLDPARSARMFRKTAEDLTDFSRGLSSARLHKSGEHFETDWKKTMKAVSGEDLPPKAMKRFMSWLSEAGKSGDARRRWRRAAIIVSGILLALAALPPSRRRASFEDQLHRLRIQAEILRDRAGEQMVKRRRSWRAVRDQISQQSRELRDLARETGEGMKTDASAFRKRITEAYHQLGEILSKH